MNFQNRPVLRGRRHGHHPFLQHMGETTGWFTNQELTTMIAVSESTPGPMGVNMATYVGFHMGAPPSWAPWAASWARWWPPWA